MKIAYHEISSVIEILPGGVQSLVIENESLLFRFLKDIKEMMDGHEGEIIFSIDEKPVAAEKHVDLLTDFISFDLNRRTLLTKIISSMDQNAINAACYTRTMELLAELEEYIIDLSMDFPCDIYCEKLSMQNILKAVGISIEDNYDTLEQRLLAYMDLVQEFVGDRLFILVNVRCMIPQNQLQKLVDTALQREHKILMIDNVEYVKLEQEDRLVIDADLCEI